mgnify:CR=1 FL=1
MADIKQDLLSLNYSTSFELKGMEEADINLSLTPAVPPTASVYGTVTDGTLPLPNATVKLFDSLGIPYQHTLTDASGAYTFSAVPAGTYSVGAVLSGYPMSSAVGVTLTEGGSAEVPLVCTADATLSLGTIAGVLSAVTLQGTKPLAGAKITLLDLDGTVVASTYTADDGEFVFYDVADGAYKLMAAADGYLASTPTAVTILKGSIANVTMTMEVDARTYNGTVSGVIRNASGAAVAGCFVGLYQVTRVGETSVETLIATTKTNAEGKYLFGGVIGGQYLVKAKLEQ